MFPVHLLVGSIMVSCLSSCLIVMSMLFGMSSSSDACFCCLGYQKGEIQVSFEITCFSKIMICEIILKSSYIENHVRREFVAVTVAGLNMS